ncbi:MAG: histidine phosphatase family protein [Hyphomicrobiaceae bacterium]
MTRILSLLRHAKSSWDDPRLPDAKRGLSERGRKAAPLMGRYIADEGLMPDLVLSSSSVRTRQTCELVFPEGRHRPPIHFEDAIYLASLQTLLALIQGTAVGVRHLMIVGHNPGLQRLALALIGSGPSRAKAALAEKFPTAALAVLELGGDDWQATAPGKARLLRFVTPRSLAD